MKKCVLSDGYIGSAYREAGYDCINREQYDCLRDSFEKLEALLQDYDVVINCIAVTDTKWSEQKENFRTVWNVNADFVDKLSLYCNKTNKKFIHISTGDLYGTNFEWEKNIESRPDLDVATTYRFSKFAAEKFCSENDLILRIRLPFDERNHPKNLLVKAQKYTKFYRWLNTFTYVPDLMKATQILLEKDQKGIFNIVQHEGINIFSLQKNIDAENVRGIDFHDKNDPNLLGSKDIVHVHNDINVAKLQEFMKTEKPVDAWVKSWDILKNTLTPPKDNV